MRAILLILILAVVAVIIAVATGFLDLRQTRGAQAPDIAASRNGVTATGGQTPAFEVETGTLSVGAQPANVNVTVPVPRLQVNPPAGQQPQPVTNTAQ